MMNWELWTHPSLADDLRRGKSPALAAIAQFEIFPDYDRAGGIGMDFQSASQKSFPDGRDVRPERQTHLDR
jgi:hypothetical protein